MPNPGGEAAAGDLWQAAQSVQLIALVQLIYAQGQRAANRSGKLGGLISTIT